MATLAENAAAVKAAQVAIDAAIVAKGGTTDGGLTNAAAAIAALPSGGGGWVKRPWNEDGWCHIWVDFKNISDKRLHIWAKFVAHDGIDVDWGDGHTNHYSVSFTSETNYDFSHEYQTDGPHEVKISGYTSISDNGHTPMFKREEISDFFGLSVRQVEMGSRSHAYGYNEAWSRFCGCENLAYLEYGNGNGNDEVANVFGNSLSSLRGIYFPSTIKSVGNFVNLPALDDLTFADGCMLDSFSSSMSATKIKELYIPFSNGGAFAQGGTFMGSSYIKKVEFGEGVSTVSSGNLFRSCPFLETVVLPSTVTTMTGDWMFYLTSYAVQEGLTLVVKATTPPLLSSSNVLGGSVNVRWNKIIVPKGCLAAYQNASNWSVKSSLMEESED